MSKTVITFGRMNPPTIGHQKVVDKVKAEAKKQGAMPHVYLSHSQDAKKNPLDYNTKIGIARKAFGPSVTKSKARTIIEVVQELERMGHKEVTLIAGSDRVAEFRKLLNRYNGKDFTFDKITVKSAGQRDPDAEGASGMSATKMRTAAQTGDFKSFKKGVPSALKDADAKKMYDKIRSVMEEIEVPEIDDDIEITEVELDAFIEMTDLDSLDEFDNIDEEFEEYLDEVRKPLTISQRMAKGRLMKRLAPRMARARRIRAKRMADRPRLERRARKAAIKLLRKKFAGKRGENYASLNPGAKMTVDKIIQKKMAMVGKIAKRMLPKVRKKEMERLKKARSGSKPLSAVAIGAAQSQANEMVEQAPNTADAMKRHKAGKAGFTDKAHLKAKGLIPRADGTKKKSPKYEEVLWEDESDSMNTKMMSMIRQAFRNPQERLLVIRALKGGEKSLANPKLRPFLLKLLNRLLDVTREDPAMLNKMKDKMRRMGQEAEKMNEREDPDIGDREGMQPAKYHSGLAKSTKKKRDAQFKKQSKMDDDNPAAYKPAPGDKKSKTKPSQYTQRYKAMYGEDVNDLFEKMLVKEEVLTEKQIEGLKKKSEKSGIPYGILKQVYNRGMAAWRTGHRPGTTPQQWAFARVNSFLTGGKTRTTADKDLWAKASAARKSRKEELDKEDEPQVKKIIKKLKGASKAHAGQAKDLEKAVSEDVSEIARSMTPMRDRFGSGKAVKVGDTVKVKLNRKGREYIEKGKVTKIEKDSIIVKHDFSRTPSRVSMKNIVKESAVDATKARIDREKESDKRKHDRMLDTARTRDTQAKNRSEAEHSHEIEVDGYQTKNFHMCGSAQKVMPKLAGKEGAKALTQMQDIFYGLEKEIMKSGSASDEQKAKARDMYNKIMAKAKKHGLDGAISGYMKMHIDSIEKGKPKLGFGQTNLKESIDEKFESLFLEEPRVPRKAGQPAGSDKHSDLYTDENPKGTIHGLKFATVQDAEKSVKKIESSDRKHAHKIQAAIAMEQRARVAGKKGAADVYRKYINKMKKKTKERQQDEGLWDNIRKKRERIKRGSGERMRKPGAKGAPTADQMRQAKGESVSEEGGAGEFGTKEVLQNYQKDTPGQDCSCYDHELTEAEYKGRKVTLNDPFRSNDGKKKFYVYVKNDKGNIIKLGFGDPNMEIKRDDPARRKSFRARHNCDNPGPKYKARYWSCFQWRAGSKVDN